MAVPRLISLLITCHFLCVATATNILYIGGLFDFNANDAHRIISAAQTAIQEINSGHFVNGSTLQLLVNNTRDYDFTSASGVYNYLNSGPNKIMLLGPADNDIAKAIAHHAGAPSYGVLQFSYGTNDLYLSNYRGLYPYFFRTSPSMATFDDLRIAFLKYYGWTEVGIVYGDNIHGAKLSNNLKTRIQSQSNIKVLAEVRLQANDPERAVRTIQDKNIHVIIGLFPLDISARRLFCQAHRHGLYGPHYIWILQMAKNNGWWNPSPGEDIGGCQSIEMACQIRNYFSVIPANEVFSSAKNFPHSKKNSSQVLDTLRSQANATTVDDVMMYTYDAVWSIAHVLEKSRVLLGKPLENVTYYGDTSATSVFYSEALKLDFDTPKLEKVRFYQNGDRKFDMSVEQVVIKDENSNPVSEVAGKYDLSTGSYAENKVSWPANTPYKKITETRVTRFIHRALFGAMIFLACLGILYAIVCFVVVVVFRKQPIIWNSSPIINIIIILGCILNYITIILYAFDWTTTASTTSFCRARAWTFAIGFTLSVGGLVAKLWIAYCVLSERFVRRWRNVLIWMLAIVLFLFLLDLIILGCWEGMDPLYATIETYKEQEEYKCFQPITDNTFKAYYYTVEHCTSSTPLAWLLIILILKFLVVIFGVFLAWQTRKLYIKSLNDTQYCAFCLFVVVFFVAFGALIALLTTRFPNVFFAVVGIFLFLCTTIILGLLFIHKMARVVCKPRRGKRILVTGSDSDTNSTSSAKNCTCCGFSGACCIACCGCFPCCNMYFCCRSCCLGSKIHPSESSSDDKTEFYIAGQPQDKEGQIAYLLREIHERDKELARLRPKHTSTSMWTQTYDDDMDEYQEREDGDGSSMDSENSEGSLDSSGKRRKRKPSRFKIYNQGVDYSHVQSKVDSGIAKSPGKSAKTKKNHDEKYYLGVWKSKGGQPSDAEIAKLRAQLEEKDKEIEKLKKEKEGETSVVIHQPNSLNRKITIVNEKAPVTQEKQCQTDDNALHIDQLSDGKPNNVVVVMETPVKNEGPSRDKPSTDVIVVVETPVKNEEPPRDKPSNNVIVVMETPVKNEEPPRDKPSNDVIVAMETLVKNESSPTKKPAKGKKTAKTEPKENAHVEEKSKNTKKKSKKEKAKSPDEWLFGKPEDEKPKDEKNDVNVIVVAKPEDKKDGPVGEEKNTTVVIIAPEQLKETEDKRKSHNESGTNVIIVRADQENVAHEEEEEKTKEEKKRLAEEKERKEEEERREEKQKKEEKRQEEEKRKEQERKDEEENRKKEENKLEEERKRQEEKRKEEERKRKEEEDRKQQEEQQRKEEQNRQEEEERKRKEEEDRKQQEEQRKEEQNRQEEEERKRKEEEDKKQQEERQRKEQNRQEEEERKRKEEEDRKQQEEQQRKEEKNRQEEEERKRKEEEDKKQQEERQRKEEQNRQEEEERKRKEEEDKQKEEEEKKEDKPNEDIEEEETIPIRPPQNTPASVGGPQQEENKDDDQRSKDDVIEEEEDKEPEKDNDNGNGDQPLDNDRGDDRDDDDNDNDADADDDDASDNDEGDEEGGDHDGQNGEAKSDEKRDKKKSPKPKKKPRKPIEGKLNWNAVSKIDTSSGYKKKPRSKIKTYKVDYSHVKSKYSYGIAKKEQDDTTEREDKEKPKNKKASVKGNRWNPNRTNTRR